MAQLWLGTSGFRYKEWRPLFYPADLPETQFLRYYAAQFNSVEVDATFYRMPTAKTLRDWRDATGEGFRFALKASRRITHDDPLKVPSEALKYWLRTVPGLGSRLGLVLYQLPPFFRADLQKLKTFLTVLPPGLRSAFEFRHDSWFRPETYALLREHGAGLCVHDADERTTPLEVTAPFAYVRLRRSAYPEPLREEWRRRMRAWVAGGLDVFAYVKHEDPPDAPLIARQMVEGFKAAG